MDAKNANSEERRWDVDRNETAGRRGKGGLGQERHRLVGSANGEAAMGVGRSCWLRRRNRKAQPSAVDWEAVARVFRLSLRGAVIGCCPVLTVETSLGDSGRWEVRSRTTNTRLAAGSFSRFLFRSTVYFFVLPSRA